MPRYVVLHHQMPPDAARPSHWDLMLEWQGVLRTWALAQMPGEPGPVPAEPLADHRLKYLTYEGPVSQGRGVVSRWDAGEYRVEDEQRGRLVLRMFGERLRGRAMLECVEPHQRWTFCFSPDAVDDASAVLNDG